MKARSEKEDLHRGPENTQTTSEKKKENKRSGPQLSKMPLLMGVKELGLPTH